MGSLVLGASGLAAHVPSEVALGAGRREAAAFEVEAEADRLAIRGLLDQALRQELVPPGGVGRLIPRLALLGAFAIALGLAQVVQPALEPLDLLLRLVKSALKPAIRLGLDVGLRAA